MDMETSILFLNKVQDAFNFGKYDPCNYNYLEILEGLKEAFKNSGKTYYAKAISHIILLWKRNQDVPKESFIRLIKSLKKEIR